MVKMRSNNRDWTYLDRECLVEIAQAVYENKLARLTGSLLDLRSQNKNKFKTSY